MRTAIPILLAIVLTVACTPSEDSSGTASGIARPARGSVAIGQSAPEISGKDLDGVAFKLSDYRGKVVMLDFWGDW